MAPNKLKQSEKKIVLKKSRKSLVLPWKKDIEQYRKCQPRGPPSMPDCSHKKGKLECGRVGREDVERFHKKFYQTRDRWVQDSFILRHCEASRGTGKRRAISTAYFIPAGHQQDRVRVCRSAFLRALSVRGSRLDRILRLCKEDMEAERRREEAKKKKKVVTFALENQYKHFDTSGLQTESFSSSDDIFNNTFNVTSKAFPDLQLPEIEEAVALAKYAEDLPRRETEEACFQANNISHNPKDCTQQQSSNDPNDAHPALREEAEAKENIHVPNTSEHVVLQNNNFTNINKKETFNSKKLTDKLLPLKVQTQQSSKSYTKSVNQRQLNHERTNHIKNTANINENQNYFRPLCFDENDTFTLRNEAIKKMQAFFSNKEKQEQIYFEINSKKENRTARKNKTETIKENLITNKDNTPRKPLHTLHSNTNLENDKTLSDSSLNASNNTAEANCRNLENTENETSMQNVETNGYESNNNQEKDIVRCEIIQPNVMTVNSLLSTFQFSIDKEIKTSNSTTKDKAHTDSNKNMKILNEISKLKSETPVRGQAIDFQVVNNITDSQKTNRVGLSILSNNRMHSHTDSTNFKNLEVRKIGQDEIQEKISKDKENMVSVGLSESGKTYQKTPKKAQRKLGRRNLVPTTASALKPKLVL